MSPPDLRQALRTVLRRPAFALAAVITLALGVAATTAMYALVDWLLYRPVPGVQAPDDLVRVRFQIDGSSMGLGMLNIGVAHPTFTDLRAAAGGFAELAAHTPVEVNLGARSGAPAERVDAAVVSGGFFGMLGLTAQQGRLLGVDDDRAEAPPAVVLSDRLWRTSFGADPAMVGSQVRLGGSSFTVVGVAEQGFRGIDLSHPRDLWLPVWHQGLALADLRGDALDDRRAQSIAGLVGRLAPGAAPARVRQELGALMQGLQERHPEAYSFLPQVSITRDVGLPAERRADLQRNGVLLFASVALILLIACANTANLLLARAVQRRHEMAVRRALGAGRGRLVGQLLAESALLAVAAGIAGALGAAWILEALEGVRLTGNLPPVVDIAMSGRVLGFAATVAGGSILLFGLVPAWLGTGAAAGEALRAGRMRADRRGGRIQRSLVSVQVAMSLVLAVGAVLLLRSLMNLSAIDPGFEAKPVLAVSIDLESQGYAAGSTAAFWRDLTDHVRTIPGVEAVAPARTSPLAGTLTGTRLWPVDRPAPDAAPPWVIGNMTGEDYFRVLGIPLTAGRMYRDGQEGVLVVNETLARTLWPGTEPADVIGRTVLFDVRDGSRLEVIGVVRDARFRDALAPPEGQWFRPLAGGVLRSGTLMVRAGGDPRAALPAVRARMSALDADIPAYDATTLQARVQRAFTEQRTLAALLGGLGALGVLLGCMGLYGVLSFTVATRVPELAVRRALGADAGSLVRLVMRDALGVTAVGIVVGIVLAAWGAGLLRLHLYGVTTTDPTTFGIVAGLLLMSAALAAALPARRAVNLEPGLALRQQ